MAEGFVIWSGGFQGAGLIFLEDYFIVLHMLGNSLCYHLFSKEFDFLRKLFCSLHKAYRS